MATDLRLTVLDATALLSATAFAAVPAGWMLTPLARRLEAYIRDSGLRASGGVVLGVASMVTLRYFQPVIFPAPVAPAWQMPGGTGIHEGANGDAPWLGGRRVRWGGT
ncbi:MAG: hypothetical protein JWN86_3393 [Planctomycetota bacterium]|nr:hypothetical protein [Planctomycetota bacterium]